MSSLIGSTPDSSRALDQIGRRGRLALAFERRTGRTVLTHRRFTLPLQVLEPLSLDADPSVCVTLLNPTGGILGGDHLTSEIALGSGTHVCVTTPSATKVYRSAGDPSIQELTFALGQDAVLEYVPDHVIPHPGAIFQQSVTVDMARGSRAILFDAFAIGRLARGEQWEFTQLVHRMTVRVEGRPVFVDRLRAEPATQTLGRVGGMDGFGYLATLALVADREESWGRISDALRARFQGIPSVVGGVSPLGQHGCLVRFLAPSAPAMTQMFQLLWSTSRELLLGLPPLSLRKY